MQTLETDYLVVGAGAAGMAFTDALLTHSDATVTIVDRGHSPGGHWLDAYPFVRLHQPSAFYGVDSVPLGQDVIDTNGTNAGFYELASADELRAYFERVVPPSSIRWVRPREGWWMNRRFQQPHTLLPDFFHGNAIQIAAMAEATSCDDVLARLEEHGIFFRLDRARTPTMLHGGIISESELELARRVEDVVRLGHVQKIEPDEIVLEHGRVPNDARTVHVSCAARGLGRPPLRPIFEKDRVTVQPADYLTAFLAMMSFGVASAAHPKLQSWSRTSRLNPVGALASYKDDPRVVAARGRDQALRRARRDQRSQARRRVARIGMLTADTTKEGSRCSM